MYGSARARSPKRPRPWTASNGRRDGVDRLRRIPVGRATAQARAVGEDPGHEAAGLRSRPPAARSRAGANVAAPRPRSPRQENSYLNRELRVCRSRLHRAQRLASGSGRRLTCAGTYFGPPAHRDVPEVVSPRSGGGSRCACEAFERVTGTASSRFGRWLDEDRRIAEPLVERLQPSAARTESIGWRSSRSPAFMICPGSS